MESHCIGCLNIGAEKYEKLKNDSLSWYCPNCAMEIPFSTISSKGLETMLFGGSSKILAKLLTEPFNKKTAEKLKTFHEVRQLFHKSENSVSCDYYTYSIRTKQD